jgi:hypothetical protein
MAELVQQFVLDVAKCSVDIEGHALRTTVRKAVCFTKSMTPAPKLQSFFPDSTCFPIGS